MNIIFSLTNLSRGGAQLFVIHLAHEFAKEKQNNVYIYDHNPEYSSKEIYAYSKNKIKILSYSENKIFRFIILHFNGLLKRIGINWNFRYYYNKNKFKKVLKKKKIELVNSHMSESDFICAETLPDSIKFIVTLHGEIELYKNNPVIYSRVKKLLDRNPFIIYTAEKNKNIIENLLTEKNIANEKIYIGINPSIFKIRKINKEELFGTEDIFILGMISRGIPEKGWLFLIQLFEKLSKKHNQLRLLLIGEGNYLSSEVNKKNNPKIKLIQLTNNFQDYFSFYNVIDLFIFPSFFDGESVPTVVAESMFWGVPVIANEHAEIKNMIHTDCGLAGECVKIESRDKMINNYFHFIELLLKNPEILNEKKNNCKSAFSKFDISTIKAEYWQIFQKHS